MRDKRLVAMVVLLLTVAVFAWQSVLADSVPSPDWPALPTDGAPQLYGKDGIVLTPTPALDVQMEHEPSTAPLPIQFRKRVNLSKGMALPPDETLWHISVLRTDGNVDSYVVPERLFVDRSDKNLQALFALNVGDLLGFSQKISRQVVEEMYP